MNLRDITSADLAAVLQLNNAHAPAVNPLSLAELERAVAHAVSARLAENATGAAPVGLLIAFDDKTPSQGPNHGWFLERDRSLRSGFVYVDRVAIEASARGQGLGRRLYHDLALIAAARPLCCEVNLEPPNPESLAFHARLGFVPCGEATDPRNGKRVRYLVSPALAFQS